MKQQKGYVHIYCGDGKGKTTAAVGLAVRAAGRGMRVLIVRFLKTEDSGEVSVLRRIPGIEVVPCEKTFGFTFRMTEEERREASEWYGQMLETACARAVKEKFDLVIFDEIMAACNTGLTKEERVAEFLKTRPEGMEVVFTGRNPSDCMKKMADYISEIHAEKHPFEKGIGARKGIEY